LLAATYTVQAVDFIGCSATTIVTINEPSALIWNSVTTNPVLCNGQSNGSIVIAATGGSGGYTYTLNPGSVNNSNGQFNTLNAGSYTIQVSDANACSNVTVVNISEPGLLNWSALSSSNVTCNGYADASINATAIGGQGSINYTLQPGNIQNSTGIYNGLNAGIYTVTATDQNACSISTVTTLTEPNALNFTVVQNTIPSCVPGNDASINVSVSGGTPNYTYTIGSGNQGNGNFLNLGAGNYIVVASDNNACSISTSVNIASPPNVSWSNVTVTNANCFGVADGQISALATTANPVLNYTLNPGNLSGSGNFTSLAANTYTLTATDAIGCSAISLVQINQPTQILFNGVVSNPALCQGSNTGSISLSANGGSGALSYTLLPGSVTNSTGVFNNLSSAAYTVIATDLNGCSNSTIVNVTQPISMQWSSVSPQMVNCFGQNDGSIISTATGGSGLLTYQILPGSVSNTSGTFNNLTAGVYSITATDVNLCFISTTVSISEPLPLQIINVSQTPLSCVPGNDASIIVSVSGGTPTYQYAINGGSLQSSNQFSNLSPGQYTVTATDLNSCTVSTIVVAQAPVVLSWTNATSTPVSCSGSSDGDISVLISNNNGGLQYVLNAGLQQNASGNFSGLTAGLYTVVATDALNCSLATTLLVGSPLPVQVNSFTKTDPSCFGDNNGSAQISASGGTGSFLYQIQPGNITTSSGIFNALGANNYTITATDINGCSVSTLFSLMQPQQLLINAVVTKETGCVPNNTGSISVYAAGGSGALSYSVGGVFGVSPTFNNLIAAPYVVVVKDANGCTVSSATVVNQTPSPGFTFVNHEDLLCHSDNTGSLQAYATGPAQIINYNLQPGNRDTLIPSFVNLPAANYVVTVTDVNGCTSTTNINVLNPEALSFSQFDVIHPNCADAQSGQILSEVVGGTGNIEYTLWPGSQTNSFGDYTLLNPKLYTIVAKDANGCSISRLETLVQENCCDNIFVPNAFSPNNDALNDEFRMVNAYGIDLKKFVVMNRWGNVVFESTNPQIGWNGRHDGELCEVGNYYYLIQYVCPETKKEYLLKGDLMLMR
jgi:gliding motility-associated-like protein